MSESAALNSVLHTWQIVSHTRLTLDSIFAEFSPLSQVCWLLALLENIDQLRYSSQQCRFRVEMFYLILSSEGLSNKLFLA